jgi:alpha-L-rhamnosidase
MVCLDLAGIRMPAPAQQPADSSPTTISVPFPPLWSGYNTRPKDCHVALVEKSGRKILAGVETIGDLRSRHSKQQATLLVLEKGFWSDPIPLSNPGVVYFPSVAVAGDGAVWLAWSEFEAGGWHIKARSWTKGALGPISTLSSGARVNLKPTIVALSGGEVFVAWEAGVNQRFHIHAASLRGGRWSAPVVVSAGGMHEFRPAVASDAAGRLWLAWQRFERGVYTTMLKVLAGMRWSQEYQMLPGTEDTRGPHVSVDVLGRAWVLSGGRLAGLDAKGLRYELEAYPKWGRPEGRHPALASGADHFSIDPVGRFWFFQVRALRDAWDWLAAYRNARAAFAVADDRGLHELAEQEVELGYSRPQIDQDGNVWALNRNTLLRFAAPVPLRQGNPSVKLSPLAPGAPETPAKSWPRPEIEVAGRKMRVFWAEMHNHLLELPRDIEIASWVDRLYLMGRYRDGLDVVALTDHDWPGMNNSMYAVEQAIASVLDSPGEYLAMTGFEWSGDSQTRARYGDRTVIFSGGYTAIPRITDGSANTTQKLHEENRRSGAIAWPHHIGRAFSPVDPRLLIPETEPVVEMVSGHGVFETYDPAHAVTERPGVPLVDGTSMQDALAAGKRVGMVGSSDSHSGFSGYPRGMLAVVAPDLTNSSILDAIRRRRTYALRGGRPIFVEFRANGRFMGEEFSNREQPRLEVTVEGSSPIARVDVVRNNRFVLSKRFDGTPSRVRVDYQDSEPLPAFYYVRVFQQKGEYAWTSPIWVDAPSGSYHRAIVAGSLVLAGGCFAVMLRRRPRKRRSMQFAAPRMEKTWRTSLDSRWPARLLGLILMLPALAPAAGQDPSAPEKLRCEYLENPLGIDVLSPRLSWQLRDSRRGAGQTAYQIQVASSVELLGKGRGDLWDSGKVNSAETIQVAYGGKAMGSGQRCYWRVRSWDAGGKPSPWSAAAHWSMGLLSPSDWEAQWITDAQAAARIPVYPRFGYQSRPSQGADVPHTDAEFAAATAWAERWADDPKWIVLDLGKPQTIDGIRLYPARNLARAPETPAYMFPFRFRIEAALTSNFSGAKAVVDRTATDEPNPGDTPAIYRFTPVEARFIRLVFTRLREFDEELHGIALAEIQVLSGGRNVAGGARVTTADREKGMDWSPDFLVDGQLKSNAGNIRSTPCQVLRKEFRLAGTVSRAVAHVTARGLYELRINGRRVGDRILAPEWTDYHKRLQYQTYDVTPLVQPGTNAISATVANGWYAGTLGIAPWPWRHTYGKYPQLLLQLEIEVATGERHTIATDESWKSTEDGPVRYADHMEGEVYDARMELPGHDRPGFDDSRWRPVRIEPLDAVRLVAQRNEPIRITRELTPVALTEPRPGVYVFDLGQNMVGWCRLKARGRRATRILLRHGEALGRQGTLYTANLRTALARDEYVLNGSGEEVLEPHFTYHGFRYVEVTGLDYRPKLEDLTGRVFHSDAPGAGSFSSSNELVNRLMSNVRWTIEGNLHSVPTDCPQRDERMGWGADGYLGVSTAMFLMDVAAFSNKWLTDIREGQAEDGRYPHMAPMTLPWRPNLGGPLWSDVGVLLPWRVYEFYADRRLLEEHFDSVTRWIEFIRGQNPDLIWRNRRGGDWGDWLNGDTLRLEGFPREGSAVPKDLFATAYFAHSSATAARMAKVLGRNSDAENYGRLTQEIRRAFLREYVQPDGRLHGDTQAGYALALHYDLLEESMRPRALEHLLEAIRRFRGHLSTGIAATVPLMHALSANGHHEEACRLINLRDVPSWGHMIDHGATTVWERWDTYAPGRGFHNPKMNSHNHPALAAIGDWVWRNIVGIAPDGHSPAFAHFTVRPRPGPGFTWARGEYQSARGTIVCDWKAGNGRIDVRVTVPANARATIFVPASGAKAVMESGRPLETASGLRFLRFEDGAAVVEATAGSYSFSAPYGGSAKQ